MKLYQVPVLGLAASALGSSLNHHQASNESCPGYTASNIQDSGFKVTADLKLAGTACNVYGTDLVDLKLEVVYETESRLHVKIYDAEELAYQVPNSVFPRPSSDDVSPYASALAFSYTNNPFAFSVVRKSTNETIFDTSAASLVFESQYLRLRTRLPESPYLYGLGEHTDPFRLNNTNYTRTLWNRDAYGVPTGSNLYGHHPIYFDHRGSAGTHGVFLLSSAGMDIKINNTDGQYLEYNALGGIFDFYFLAGPTPKDVSVQYSEISGKAAMQPYWGFGFHQCRYGYRDVFAVAETVANYSRAEIPLETMWTDIDYMYLRRVFTLDPERFPLEMMRQLVDTLHANQQKYIVMVDPAVSDRSSGVANFGYTDGVDLGIFLKNTNGSGYYKGSVWPGPTVYPDWFHADAQEYWTNQFARFFDAETGLDIDGLWIDMNEAANFCTFPCLDPEGYANDTGAPPTPPLIRNNSGRPIPGFPGVFQPPVSHKRLRARQNNSTGKHLGQPGRDLLNPKYQIQNAAGVLSMNTIQTNIANYDGSHQYDTHNLYGSMMSIASRNALLARRPNRRPLVITRSTFAGAGSHVGKWLGDNLSLWEHYRTSIANILEFASLYQIPMIGADVCGFGANTTETLCARWATLGAFYPFFRNHNGDTSISQEFYLWPTVTEAAKNAINVRYRLLDYIYTHLHRQSTTGLPMLNPMFFQYPEDTNTFAIEHQFFYGDNILVSPVLEENSTDVSIYLPKGIFYDYWTHEKIESTGSYIELNNIPFTSIPLHIRGGAIIPLRAESANTTTELRKKNFILWIAPDEENKAQGTLFLDDGDSVGLSPSSDIKFAYANGTFTMTGTFDYKIDVIISEITILGFGSAGNLSTQSKVVSSSKTITGPISLTEEFKKRL